MYKILGRVLIVAILLTLAVGFSSAQDDTPLESYLPANTELYASLRIDDGYIETLDGVYAGVINRLSGMSIGAAIPPEMSSMSLAAILDLGSMQFFGGDFQTAVRSWLGGRMVVGAADFAALVDNDPANDTQTKLIAAVEITDSAMTRSVVETILRMTGLLDAYQESSEGGFTVLSAAMPQFPNILIGDDVLIVGLNIGVADVTGASILDNADFNDTMSQLPADSYNGMVYVNVTATMEAALAANPVPDDTMGLVASLASAMGQQAMGITLLDGRSFVLDVVQATGDMSELESMGFSMDMLGSIMGAYTPIDPAFTNNLPADSEFVLHGSNLRGVYDSLIMTGEAAEALDPTGATESIEAAVAQMEAEFKNATGLSLQDDVLTWLEGDYAAFAWLSAEPNTPSAFTQYFYALDGIDIPVGVEGAVVVETTNPAGSRAVFDALAGALPDLVAENDGDGTATFEQTTIGGADALVLSISSPVDHNYDALVEAGTFTPSNQIVELVFATDDNLVVAGTPGAVEAVFAGGGLANAAHYQANAAYFLPNTSAIYYISDAGFNTLFDFVAVGGQQVGEVFENIIMQLEGGETQEPDLAELQARFDDDLARRQAQAAELGMGYQLAEEVASLFSGTSITASFSESGAVTLRAVISLAP